MTSKIPFYCSDGHIGQWNHCFVTAILLQQHAEVGQRRGVGLRCHSQAIPLSKESTRGWQRPHDSTGMGPLPLVRRPRSFRNVPISKRIVVLAEALRKASRMIKLWETKPWPVKPMDLEKCHVIFMIHIHYINSCVFQRFSGLRLKLHQHFQGLKHEISLPHHNVFEIVPQPLTPPLQT